jgi:hypothetical protein
MGGRYSSRQIEESISILNFFPPFLGVDFYFEFLPAKFRSRFLLPISSPSPIAIAHRHRRRGRDHNNGGGDDDDVLPDMR